MPVEHSHKPLVQADRSTERRTGGVDGSARASSRAAEPVRPGDRRCRRGGLALRGGRCVAWLDIDTEQGIAALSRSVDNVLAKSRAARVASTVKGVRSVVNRIKVQPDKPRSDEEIRQDVTQELAADPAADSYELAAEVDDGVVALPDTVKS